MQASTFFLLLGVIGALFFLFRIVLMLFGLDDSDIDTDMDFDADIDADIDTDVDTDMDADLQLLSIQGLAGATMIFGFTAYTLTRGTGLNMMINLAISLGAGLFTLWLIARLYLAIRSLDSSGNVDLNTACGQEASVYLTIPPKGTGKIQAKLGGSLKVIDARTEENEAIPTGKRVLVKYVADDNVMVVSPVRSEYDQL
ncbi:MAG: hypothetical protein ACOC2L_05780 [Candidatus Sumerlaeota bacterium]